MSMASGDQPGGSRKCELNPASAIQIAVEHLRRELLRKSRLADPPVTTSVNSLVVPSRCSRSINTCSRPTKLLSSAGMNRCHAICKCTRLCEIRLIVMMTSHDTVKCRRSSWPQRPIVMTTMSIFASLAPVALVPIGEQLTWTLLTLVLCRRSTRSSMTWRIG
jgi:hypothetical protein